MLKAQAIGHLGKDAVVNTVNGKSVINFTVAHSEKYKDAQGVLHEKTIWVDCSYWSDRTAVAQYLKKGTQVYVDGNPEARSFQRNDGTPGAALALRVRDIQLLSSGNKENRGPVNNNIPVHSSAHTTNGGTGYVENPNDITEPVDDLPF
jgi:single-strand DNA-binding protein